jgi:hypothetical protein
MYTSVAPEATLVNPRRGSCGKAGGLRFAAALEGLLLVDVELDLVDVLVDPTMKSQHTVQLDTETRIEYELEMIETKRKK